MVSPLDIDKNICLEEEFVSFRADRLFSVGELDDFLQENIPNRFRHLEKHPIGIYEISYTWDIKEIKGKGLFGQETSDYVYRVTYFVNPGAGDWGSAGYHDPEGYEKGLY